MYKATAHYVLTSVQADPRKRQPSPDQIPTVSLCLFVCLFVFVCFFYIMSYSMEYLSEDGICPLEVGGKTASIIT